MQTEAVEEVVAAGTDPVGLVEVPESAAVELASLFAVAEQKTAEEDSSVLSGSSPGPVADAVVAADTEGENKPQDSAMKQPVG